MLGSSSTMTIRLAAIAGSRTRFHGQQHTKSSPAEFPADQHDVAAIHQCTLPGYGQAEPHPSFLESNRRLEQRAGRFVTQTRTGIMNLNTDLPVLNCRDAENRTRRAGGFGSVFEKI